MPHRNIPIFIPHLGCPNQCVFCNQRSISGCSEFRERDVERLIETALSTLPRGSESEIAFFGGSFTGIDRGLMIRLLELAERYVRQGSVNSIRLSTRPDYVDGEILEILSRYSVRVIELGLQSMDNRVLTATKRGHTVSRAEEACRAVVAAGFSLVGQMMIGLPEANEANEILTAKRIVELGASAARIYPTVVFQDTPLCEMYLDGRYHPLSTEEAVQRSTAALRVFTEHRVPCIRIGLCASEELVSPTIAVAGPNHPALGELVWNEYYYRIMIDRLRASDLLGRDVILQVPEHSVSKIVGQHRRNLVRLLRETDTRVKKIVGEKNREEITPIAWRVSE